MGWRIVKQPNGLFARFSEVVDHFTVMDLSESLVIRTCLDLGCSEDEAQGKLERAIRDIKPYSNSEGNGLDRWSHCLGIIERIYGEEDRKAVQQLGEKV